MNLYRGLIAAKLLRNQTLIRHLYKGKQMQREERGLEIFLLSFTFQNLVEYVRSSRHLIEGMRTGRCSHH